MLNSKKIVSYRRVYDSDRGNDPKVTRKLSGPLNSVIQFTL